MFMHIVSKYYFYAVIATKGFLGLWLCPREPCLLPSMLAYTWCWVWHKKPFLYAFQKHPFLSSICMSLCLFVVYPMNNRWFQSEKTIVTAFSFPGEGDSSGRWCLWLDIGNHHHYNLPCKSLITPIHSLKVSEVFNYFNK